MKRASCVFSCADIFPFFFFPSLIVFQCLAVAVPMGTQQLRAILLDQAVSAPAQVQSALLQASKREMAQKERGRQREMSTPATGKGLCFPCQKSFFCSAVSLFIEELCVGNLVGLVFLSVCLKMLHICLLLSDFSGCTWSDWCCWRGCCRTYLSWGMLGESGPSLTCR